MEVKEAKAEFGRLLDNGYYANDRSSNSAEDYSITKENRDSQAAIRYASTDEFHKFCVEEKIIDD